MKQGDFKDFIDEHVSVHAEFEGIDAGEHNLFQDERRGFAKNLLANDNPGLAMCALAISSIFLGSQIERTDISIRYYKGGRLRAYADLQSGLPHGDLVVLYPDGRLWMRGIYNLGVLQKETMQVFLPDGSSADKALRS